MDRKQSQPEASTPDSDASQANPSRNQVKQKRMKATVSSQSSTNRQKSISKKSMPPSPSQDIPSFTQGSEYPSNMPAKKVQIQLQEPNQSNRVKQFANATKNRPQIKYSNQSQKNQQTEQITNQGKLSAKQAISVSKNVDEISKKSHISNLPSAKSSRQSKQMKTGYSSNVQGQSNNDDSKKTQRVTSSQKIKENQTIEKRDKIQIDKKHQINKIQKPSPVDNQQINTNRSDDQCSEKQLKNLQRTKKNGFDEKHVLKGDQKNGKSVMKQKQKQTREESKITNQGTKKYRNSVSKQVLKTPKEQSKQIKGQKQCKQQQDLRRREISNPKNQRSSSTIPSKSNRKSQRQRNQIGAQNGSESNKCYPIHPQANKADFRKNKQQHSVYVECSINQNCPQIPSKVAAVAQTEKIVSMKDIDRGPKSSNRNSKPRSIIKTIKGGKKPYELVKKLGEGTFGQVFLTADNYAIKQIKMGAMIDKQKQLLQNEIACLKKLDHKNVVKFIQEFRVEQQQKQYIVMEYCKSSVGKQVFGVEDRSENKNVVLSQAGVLRRFSQIFEGYNELYRNKIVHRDIKPENILIGMDDECKFADFGFSKELKEYSEDLQTNVGTCYFQAYQLMLDQPCYTYKCDIWSLGVSLFYMLVGSFPWPASASCMLKKNISKIPIIDVLKNQPICHMSAKTKYMIAKMLNPNPELRISWEQLYKLFSSGEEMNYSLEKLSGEDFAGFHSEKQAFQEDVQEVMEEAEQNLNEVGNLKAEIEEQSMTASKQVASLKQHIFRQLDMSNVLLGDAKNVEVEYKVQQKVKKAKRKDGKGNEVDKEKTKKLITIRIWIDEEKTIEDQQN